MALTLKTNGSGSSNLITADWFNDFTKLFTGVMTDQPVLFKPNLTLQAIVGPPAAPTLTVVSGTGMGVGAYTWAVTFVAADGGETLAGTTATATTTTGNTVVNLSSIPVGGAGSAVAKRNLYRSKVGTSSPLFLVATLADNTTTTYSDSTPDASLPSTQPPTSPNFGGSLYIKDVSGTVGLSITSDGTATFGPKAVFSNGMQVMGTAFMGAMSVFGNLTMQTGQYIQTEQVKANPAPVTLNGATSGTATLWQPLTGTVKMVLVYVNGFRNGGASAQTLAIPVPFTSSVMFWNGGTPNISYLQAGSVKTVQSQTSLGGTGGGVTPETSVVSNIWAHADNGLDTIQFNGSQSATNTGLIIMVGI